MVTLLALLFWYLLLKYQIFLDYQLYFDYRKGLDMLSELDYSDYEYPEGKTAFHVYSEITTPKQLECVKSFLATQNLDHTRLVLWSDYDVSNNESNFPLRFTQS